MQDNTDTKSRYFIDLNWYEENNRSFRVLCQSRLCPACQDKLAAKESSEKTLVATIKKCCSKSEGFFNPKAPVFEAIFRIILANGNQALTLEEIRQRLSAQRGEHFSLSSEKLQRVIENDRHYGICPVPEVPKIQMDASPQHSAPSEGEEETNLAA